jgi:hypothetical protein
MGRVMMRPVIALLSMALLAATAPAPAPKPTPAMPAWMTGAWEFRDGERWGDEFWTPPRAGLMIGAARTGKGAVLRDWEHTRITREADGKLAYWAMPKGVPATKFVATEESPTSVTFVNAAHDYPQRVRYWREGRMLMAEIALVDGRNAFRFSYAPMGSR